MSTIIRNLISRLYRGDQEHRVVLMGLDNSGKTTLLYLLKLGQIVPTIPSIGFNVESVDAPVTNGSSFKMTLWDLGMGCGSMFYGRLVRHYMAATEAIIWVVDAADTQRLEASVQLLEEVITPDQHEDVDKSVPKSVPILILANKSDLPKASSLDQIRIAFSRFSSGRLLAVYKTAITRDTIVGTGIPEAFAWLQLVWGISGSNKAKGPSVAQDSGKATTGNVGQMSDAHSQQNKLVEKLESWLTRAEVDVSAEEFLEKFCAIKLPEWDHYTHIRIAYVLLMKHGRKDGKDLIFNGLEKYIAVSPQTKGRSFHVTMTYFWIQIVHFGIRNMSSSPLWGGITLSPSGNSTFSDDFSHFLLINPHVADGSLWSEYYTKDVMMSIKAKSEMVLPDIRPLPSLVVRDAIRSLGGNTA